jgi:hypothetical protein
MSEQQLSKTFASLMLRGKVNAALRLLDHQSAGGVLPLSDDIYEDLRKKHPSAKPGDGSVMIEGEIPFIDPALFANIDIKSRNEYRWCRWSFGVRCHWLETHSGVSEQW